MRIISGQKRGFQFPEKAMPHVRPTTDRAKESLMSILSGRFDFESCRIIDLYAGMGGVGLEFWSRGCADVTLVDASLKSTRYIQAVSEKLGANISIVTDKSIDYLNSQEKKYDIIFADPPYHAGQEIKALIDSIVNQKPLKVGGVFILEHATALQLDSKYLDEQRSYGQSTFSFFIFE